MTTILNKRILLSLGMIAFVGVIAVGATGAFFSDTETSTGNTFTAGAIDLGVDNTSYYNGVLNASTTWAIDWNLSKDAQGNPEVHQFFNFSDLKPGDWGEDTISLHVNNNDSYLCADVTLTSDNDNDITEPEGDDGDNGPAGVGNGDLADAVNFYWWADDGDNVFEDGENLLPAGPLGNLNVGQTATVALADSDQNIWGDNSTTTNALPGGQVRYVGKAWCFGESTFTPYPATDGSGSINTSPIVRPVACSGANEDNITQTDSMTADISFRAVQSRNNGQFQCTVPDGVEIQRIDRTQTEFGDGGWAGWSCPAGTTAVGGGIDSSTNPVGGNGFAAPGSPVVDGFTYPVYPHYTFTTDTGYVVHDLVDGLGNTISFHIDCQVD